MTSSNAQPAPALVLFDIDGTLMRRAGVQHFRALTEAVEQVTGCPAVTDGIQCRGMLDRDILTIMMRASGQSVRSSRQLLPEVMRVAPELYMRPGPDLRRKVCPGVRPLLKQLRKVGIPTGLVTGNLSRIAWKKLERAGLDGYFRFGAFSEQGATRASLARLAIRRARRERWIARDSVVSLIGDHPNDVIAARANGIRAVAVASGIPTREELAEHGPDILVNSMREITVSALCEPQPWLPATGEE